MTPSRIADAYFAAVRAKDIDAFIALFAPDGVMGLPNGREFAGHAAIREMQSGVFAHGSPYPTPVAMVEGADCLAVEVRAQLPDGSVRQTTNIYRLNADGLIARLTVYMRG